MAGLGVGDTAVRLIGRTPAKIATLERATTMIRTLLAKGQVEVGAAAPARLRHAAAAPVWIAAQGPKTLRMAGRVADGVFVRVGASPRGISAAISQVHQGAHEAGRDPADVAIGLVLHTVMCEDLDRAAVVGRAVTAGYYEYSPMLFDAVGLKWDGPDVETLKAQVWPDFHHAADMFAAGKLVDFLPRAAVDAFCLWGDRAQIRQQLGNVLEQFPNVQIVVPHPVPPYRPGDGPDIDYLDWFAGNVMPAFQE